ncbi:MAG: type IV toxin-antitoxin system AbiEi family antitoxin domain-containing protein [Candidatus Bathyarchaeota archaeon]|nr:type IV toxin-antitoxin system AbiEi family antitoxin domain-containing protein [Candidatus Bathyarchaeota archaeon]
MLTECKETPNYEWAFSQDNSRKIAEAIARRGGVARFSEIEATSGVKGSVLYHHLNRLERFGVIEKEVKGTYRLTYRTPLCFLYQPETKVPVVYLGLLGRREAREEPEPAVAIRLLAKEGLRPDFIYVVTSPEALNEWKDLKLPYNWILCYREEIIDVDAVKEKIEQQLISLIKQFNVIMDCTSATKPATIAYYELAQKYKVPLIYIYEENVQLKWLISKEEIAKTLTYIASKNR